MKICYLTHDLRHNTGIGVMSRHLIDKIKQARPDWDLTVLVEESIGHSLETAALRLRGRDFFKNLFRLRGYLKKCDLVHALDGFPYGLAAVLCSWGLQKKVIVTAVGSGAIVPLSRRFLAPLVKYCYRRADALTAISHYTARKIQEKISTLPITVVNLGVDLKLFEPHPEDRVFDGQARGKRPYVFSDGPLKTRKGYEVSIPAFGIVAKRFPHLNYVIMHNKVERGFWQRDRLKNLVNKLGLSSRVFFVEDPSDDLRRVLYRNAELFVLMSQETPTDMEGFGLAFLQAAACGLPVVGSKGSAVEDAMRDNQNGFLVEATDKQAVAEAIIKILGDDNLKQQFAAHSIKFAQFMSWERSAGHYVKLYEKYL